MPTLERMEIRGRVFTGPRPGNYHGADFDRPSTYISFCLIEPATVPMYPGGGVNAAAVAAIAASVAGGGFYGLERYRMRGGLER